MEDEADAPEVELTRLSGCGLIAERDREFVTAGSRGIPELSIPVDPDALIPARVAGHPRFRRLLKGAPFFFRFQANPVILGDDALFQQKTFEIGTFDSETLTETGPLACVGHRSGNRTGLRTHDVKFCRNCIQSTSNTEHERQAHDGSATHVGM